MATAHLDFGALARDSARLGFRAEREKDNLRLTFNGLFLGLDARAEV